MHRSSTRRALRLAVLASLAPAVAAAQSAAPADVQPAAASSAAAAPADTFASPAGGAKPSYRPWADYRGDAGPVLGASATWTRGGGGETPFASRDRVRLEVAPRERGAALDYARTAHGAGGTLLTVHVRASQIDPLHFQGYGNDTDGSGKRDAYEVEQDVVTVDAEVSRPVATGLRLGIGPVLRYRDAAPAAGTPFALAAPPAGDVHTTGGVRTTLSWERRDAPAFPRRGGWLLLAGEAHQGLSGSADEAFARAQGAGAAYVPVAGGTTLALRAGAERVWGAFPVQEAAFLGGQGSLRGHSRGRYAGDASAWGSAEVRASLAPANLGVVRGTLGGLLLADAGRVFMDGVSEGGWHTAYGAGAFFTTDDHAHTVTVIAARGEDGWRGYLRLGLPF